MKKKIATILICVVLVALMTVSLVACNENYKQDEIATDLSNSTVSSNGGLSVQVGKYLYFINGYADVADENTFGKAVKGAIMRVELVNGEPNRDTLVTIVPKNVYNTNTSVGLTVDGDYVYYTSPSTDKGSDGTAKTSNMWIMRTKLNGTDTQVIAKFDDYTTNFRIAGNYIVYLDAEYNLHAIDLNSKKFKDEVVAEKVNGAMLTYKNVDKNLGVIFFTKTADDKTESNNAIWAFKDGSVKNVIDGKAPYQEAGKLEHPAGYTLTIIDVQPVGNGVRLIYSKTDSGSNTISKGDYYYDFDQSLEFNVAKEVRMTSGVNYTAYNFFDGNNVLATDSDSIDYLCKSGDEWVSTVVIKASSATLLDVENNGGKISATYLASSTGYVIDVLSYDEATSTYAVERSSARIVFKSKYDTTWLSVDMVGDCLYFFNSDVAKNIYYLNLNSVIDRSDNSMIANQLGKLSKADEYKLLSSSTEA